jgi:uncharacterized protein (DUF4415 family)
MTIPDAVILKAHVLCEPKDLCNWPLQRCHRNAEILRLTIRVDHDVVEWLKRAGSGYQTRINAILRSYMKAQSE